MLTPTAILGLLRWQSTDEFDVNEVNANMDAIDAGTQSRISFHTTAGRPLTNLYAGRLIYDTTVKKVLIWDGDSWERVDQIDLLPKPVRGYFINSVKSVTATAWADVGNDNGKFIVCTKPTMIDIHLRVDITGNAATPLSVRLAWYNAIVGDSYNQYDGGILGALTATSAGERQTFGTSLLVPAGTTQFKLQAQRSNTTNPTSVNAAAIVVTPVGFGEDYAAGAD